MKKRLIATLLVGAIAVSGVIGLTACGGSGSVSLPSGEEVTKTAWTNAFDKTSELTNYTFNSSANSDVTLSGSMTDYYSDKKQEITGTAKVNASQTTFYDKDGKYAYTEASASLNSSGTSDGENANYSYKVIEKEYYEFKEKTESSYDVYWAASYSKSETSTESPEGKNSQNRESYWQAERSSYFASNEATELGKLYFYESDDDTTAERKYISDLYDSFTYSNGVYTAKLYYRQDLEIYSLTDLVECTVKVSIKDGYAVGCSIKIDVKDENLYRKGYYDITYSCKSETVVSITNIKSTDASKKATADITKAINKAKADEENN